MKTIYLIGHSAGGVLALAMSAIVNKSIGLALIHYVCSWIYVAWAVAVHISKLRAWWNAI